MNRKLILACIAIVNTFSLSAQDSTKVSIEGGFDLVSRYIWRGLQFSDTPNLQPSINVSYGGWSLMGWGSYGMGKNYAEFDLYLSYSLNGLTLSINDYYSEDETDLGAIKWSEWRKDDTAHLLEGSISYTTSGENHPLTLTASTFVYGADLDDEDDENGDGDLGDQRYSTYFEASYPFTVNNYQLTAFAGGTITPNGYYGSSAGIVNVGIEAEREIRFNEQFAIPLSLSMICNPENDDTFLVLKLTF